MPEIRGVDWPIWGKTQRLRDMDLPANKRHIPA